MKKYQTFNESVQQSIIEADAMEMGAMLGYIFVDLEGKKVTTAYFESENDGVVYPLDATSELQVITQNNVGITYHRITGQDIYNRKNDSGNPLFAGMRALYKTGGNREMKEKNMVLVDVKELEEISLTLAESLGEDNPLVLTVDAMEELEKVIEKSTVHPVIDDAALRGIAEVLDTALNSCGPYSITKTLGVIERKEDITREEMLELILEDAMETIYKLVGEEDEEKKLTTHGNE
ncbi:hypothetical protein [Psychrobacillus sp. L3]|uniref:hypothetical protein n=1 Tax=Psychrobacillus sp. L3 TaxID=3236891 RepID=UPI0036F4475A